MATPVVESLDVADHEQLFAAAAIVEQETGPIDVWVNVAFTSVFSPFDEVQPDEYRRVTEVSKHAIRDSTTCCGASCCSGTATYA